MPQMTPQQIGEIYLHVTHVNNMKPEVWLEKAIDLWPNDDREELMSTIFKAPVYGQARVNYSRGPAEMDDLVRRIPTYERPAPEPVVEQVVEQAPIGATAPAPKVSGTVQAQPLQVTRPDSIQTNLGVVKSVAGLIRSLWAMHQYEEESTIDSMIKQAMIEHQIAVDCEYLTEDVFIAITQKAFTLLNQKKFEHLGIDLPGVSPLPEPVVKEVEKGVDTSTNPRVRYTNNVNK